MNEGGGFFSEKKLTRKEKLSVLLERYVDFEVLKSVCEEKLHSLGVPLEGRFVESDKIFPAKKLMIFL
ncbi:MAG: hypothetical protein EOM19_08010, partial [Candidatus Moranbacteria bacterium]|nr:hypothetical protein [Candidatus Moranbacteria bacterium]